MNQTESNLVYYQKARDELVERIKLKDHAIRMYLVLVGSVLGITFSTSLNLKLLLTIPFIAVGITSIVLHHFSLIQALAQYCMDSFKSENKNIRHWDLSTERAKCYDEISKFKFITDLFLLIFPCVLALSVNFSCLIKFFKSILSTSSIYELSRDAWIGGVFWLLSFSSFIILILLLWRARQKTKTMENLLTKVS